MASVDDLGKLPMDHMKKKKKKLAEEILDLITESYKKDVADLKKMLGKNYKEVDRSEDFTFVQFEGKDGKTYQVNLWNLPDTDHTLRLIISEFNDKDILETSDVKQLMKKVKSLL